MENNERIFRRWDTEGFHYKVKTKTCYDLQKFVDISQEEYFLLMLTPHSQDLAQTELVFLDLEYICLLLH